MRTPDLNRYQPQSGVNASQCKEQHPSILFFL